MKRVAVVLAALAMALAGCGQTAGIGQHKPITLSAAQRAIVESGIRSRLKDPDSAKFGEMVAGTDASGATRVCGWVNAKNSFGGYGGPQIFAGQIAGAALVDVAMDSPGESFKPVAIICKNAGLMPPAT